MQHRESSHETVQPRIRLRRLLAQGAPQPVLELDGADLSGRDLRSLDLSRASLRSADLRGCRVGLSPARGALLAASSLLASVSMGVLSGFAGHRLGALMRGEEPLGRMVGRVVAVQLAMLLLVTVWKGFDVALRYLVFPSSVVAIVLSIVGVAMGRSGTGGIAILSFLILLAAILGVSTLSRAVAGSAGSFLLAVVAISGSLAGKMVGGGAIALAIALVALWLGKRALREAPKAPILARWLRSLVCRAGTSFRDADLRGARLDGTTLRCADLRGARLEGVSLSGTRLSMCELDEHQRSQCACLLTRTTGGIDQVRTSSKSSLFID